MPNILTISRIILSFFLSYFIYLNNNKISIIIFIIILLTDFLDGYIARKFNKITNLGKILDPLADRIFIILLTISLILCNKLPLYTLFIFIRDIYITILSIYIMNKNKKVISSDIYGKIKTVLHFLSLGIIIVLNRWNYISLILLIIGFLSIIPESIYGYKKYIME